jgi:hypothetical protein
MLLCDLKTIMRRIKIYIIFQFATVNFFDYFFVKQISNWYFYVSKHAISQLDGFIASFNSLKI